MPLMPMPPIPTKSMAPMSRGSLMKSFPSLRILDAPLSQGMTSGFSVIPGRSPPERTLMCNCTSGNLEIPDQPASRPVRNDWTSDSSHFHNQIGQPFGGVQPADGAGAFGHRRQPRRLGGKPRDFHRQPVGRELGLRDSG